MRGNQVNDNPSITHKGGNLEARRNTASIPYFSGYPNSASKIVTGVFDCFLILGNRSKGGDEQQRMNKGSRGMSDKT